MSGKFTCIAQLSVSSPRQLKSIRALRFTNGNVTSCHLKWIKTASRIAVVDAVNFRIGFFRENRWY